MPSYCLKCGDNTKKHYFTCLESYKRWNNIKWVIKYSSY